MKGWILASVVGVVLLLTIVQAVQISSLKSQFSGAVTSSGGTGGSIDMSGWSADEKMQYEHHGTLPAKASSGASSAKATQVVQSAPSQVGGC